VASVPAKQSLVFASLFQALASVVHWSSLAVVLTGAGFACLANLVGGSRDFATPVFSMSGTLVALILPAAGLSAQYIEPRVLYWAEVWARAEPNTTGADELGREAIRAIESVVAPLWRGFIFAFISFPLAAVALFRPSVEFATFSIEEVLVGASMGFVIVAIFSFLPFVWAILQLHLARNTRAILEASSRTATVADSQATAGGDGQSGADTAGSLAEPDHGQDC
jgi:hypothetical protein